MKKVILITLLFLSALFNHVKAQVSYGSIAWGSYNMKINVITDSDSIFLNIIYADERRKLTDTPKLLIKLMDDEVISLDGQLLDNMNKSDGGIVVSGIFLESSYFISEAKFPITKDQINLFSKGVKKLRLNTSPKYHEKEWKRDRIGKILYESYIKSSPNSFEDGF